MQRKNPHLYINEIDFISNSKVEYNLTALINEKILAYRFAKNECIK